MAVFGKIAQTLWIQCRDRGLISTFVMNLSHFSGVCRAFFYRSIYYRSIHCSIFSMQSNSTIEIFNKRAKIRIGKFVFMRKNISIRLDYSGEFIMGDYVFINDNCTINCIERISIGRSTKIAPNVCINDHDHNYKAESGGGLISSEVIIGEHVWIGSNTVILKGATIGDHAVIAAGSVVRGHVPPHTLFYNKRTNEYVSSNELRGF